MSVARVQHGHKKENHLAQSFGEILDIIPTLEMIIVSGYIGLHCSLSICLFATNVLSEIS